MSAHKTHPPTHTYTDTLPIRPPSTQYCLPSCLSLCYAGEHERYYLINPLTRPLLHLPASTLPYQARSEVIHKVKSGEHHGGGRQKHAEEPHMVPTTVRGLQSLMPKTESSTP